MQQNLLAHPTRHRAAFALAPTSRYPNGVSAYLHLFYSRFLSGFVGTLLFSITLCIPAHAQTENKNRLIFSSDTKSSESALQKPALPSDSTPQQQITPFFQLLTQKKFDSAYDLLLRDTVIAAKPTNVHELKAQTSSAIDTYGDIHGFELLSDEPAGKHLVRLTYLSLNTNLPLRWRFYFYKTSSIWRLIDVRIDDAITDIFPNGASKSSKNL